MRNKIKKRKRKSSLHANITDFILNRRLFDKEPNSSACLNVMLKYYSTNLVDLFVDIKNLLFECL